MAHEVGVHLLPQRGHHDADFVLACFLFGEDETMNVPPFGQLVRDLIGEPKIEACHLGEHLGLALRVRPFLELPGSSLRDDTNHVPPLARVLAQPAQRCLEERALRTQPLELTWEGVALGR